MTGQDWTWDMPMNSNAPRPWGMILGALAAVGYAFLALLGWFSFTHWVDLWAVEGGSFAAWGAAAAIGLGITATVCAVAKALGWWMVEWVVLWFLMSALSVHAFLDVFGTGWPEWVVAQLYFLVVCAQRNVSLMLFASQARWGVERRHLLGGRKRGEA